MREVIKKRGPESNLLDDFKVGDLVIVALGNCFLAATEEGDRNNSVVVTEGEFFRLSQSYTVIEEERFSQLIVGNDGETLSTNDRTVINCLLRDCERINEGHKLIGWIVGLTQNEMTISSSCLADCPQKREEKKDRIVPFTGKMIQIGIDFIQSINPVPFPAQRVCG